MTHVKRANDSRGVPCPVCDGVWSRITDSRPAGSKGAWRRRRECKQCGARFTTHEAHIANPVADKLGRHRALEPKRVMRLLAEAMDLLDKAQAESRTSRNAAEPSNPAST